MKMRNRPWITIGLSALMLSLLMLPPDLQSALYLKSDELTAVSLVCWVSGHFIHADVQHLIWNLIAFGVLGGILERRSKATLLASLAVGIVAVDLLLLSPLGTVQYYCGLSGVINTLLGVALWVLWKESQNRMIVIVAMANMLKITLEVIIGVSLLTDISWPPYPLSHLAGFLASPLVFLLIAKQAKVIKQVRLLSATLTL